MHGSPRGERTLLVEALPGRYMVGEADDTITITGISQMLILLRSLHVVNVLYIAED
jgi:hypothetical protein